MDEWFTNGRLTLGLGNANVTGLCLALLSVLSLLLVGKSRALSVGGIALCVLFAGAMMWTVSRGALCAWLGGTGLLGATLLVRGSAKGISPGQLAVVLLAAAAFLLGSLWLSGLSGRAAASTADPSVSTRVRIYGAVPAMFRAAPRGWGWGNAASAYENWFRSETDTHRYSNLISSHGTWLVEGGWLFGVGYIGLATILVLGLLPWTSQDPARSAICASVLFAALIGCAFSHLADRYAIWVPSAAAFGIGIVLLRRRSVLVWCRIAALSIAMASVATVMLWYRGGADLAQRPITKLPQGVLCGSGGALTVLVARDTSVLGDRPGTTIRTTLKQGGWNCARILVLENPSCPAPSGEPYHLLIAGQLGWDGTGELMVNATRKTWINPPALTPEIEKNLNRIGAVEVVWGSRRTDANPFPYKRIAQATAHMSFRTDGSFGLFVTNLQHFVY